MPTGDEGAGEAAPRSPRDKYVERMGAALTAAGLPRLPSRVFAALTATDDGRMTSAQLAATLGISPASVSSAVRYLTQIHFIHRERERGSRRDVYVVDDDAWLSAMMQEEHAYAPLIAILDEAIESLPRGTPAHLRLRLMREFLSFMIDEMDGIRDRWVRRRDDIVGELRRS